MIFQKQHDASIIRTNVRSGCDQVI